MTVQIERRAHLIVQDKAEREAKLFQRQKYEEQQATSNTFELTDKTY